MVFQLWSITRSMILEKSDDIHLSENKEKTTRTLSSAEHFVNKQKNRPNKEFSVSPVRLKELFFIGFEYSIRC